MLERINSILQMIPDGVLSKVAICSFFAGILVACAYYFWVI